MLWRDPDNPIKTWRWKMETFLSMDIAKSELCGYLRFVLSVLALHETWQTMSSLDLFVYHICTLLFFHVLRAVYILWFHFILRIALQIKFGWEIITSSVPSLHLDIHIEVWIQIYSFQIQQNQWQRSGFMCWCPRKHQPSLYKIYASVLSKSPFPNENTGQLSLG